MPTPVNCRCIGTELLQSDHFGTPPQKKNKPTQSQIKYAKVQGLVFRLPSGSLSQWPSPPGPRPKMATQKDTGLSPGGGLSPPKQFVGPASTAPRLSAHCIARHFACKCSQDCQKVISLHFGPLRPETASGVCPQRYPRGVTNPQIALFSNVLPFCGTWQKQELGFLVIFRSPQPRT